MSTSEITPAPPVRSRLGRSAEEPEANMKGPYAMTVVNESVQREQQGWGPFARKDRRSKKGDAGEIVQESAGEPQRHFKLLSLSKSSYFALREPLTL
jgi:hypothetical protein